MHGCVGFDGNVVPPDDLKFTLGDSDQIIIRQMDDVALFRYRGRRADLAPFGSAAGPDGQLRPRRSLSTAHRRVLGQVAGPPTVRAHTAPSSVPAATHSATRCRLAPVHPATPNYR